MSISSDFIILLCLVLIANGAPIFSRILFAKRFGMPVDLHYHCRDGHPLFGPSKTFRGLISSIILTSLAAIALKTPLTMGLIIAIGAMSGDLITSYFKRRHGLASKSDWNIVDQLLEAAFPLCLAKWYYDHSISWATVLFAISLFVLIGMIIAPLRLHWRNRMTSG